ncbi:hypothetical protein LA6_001222 [Marinibacterium anthonyi]|nr:hypothetical protein LA6_001222 [Marinibacterium anthonyi]
MTDPVSKLEIEDVLSSIRRLVSEEARKLPELTPKQASFDAPGPRDKLVLTPALRVPEAPQPRASGDDDLEIDGLETVGLETDGAGDPADAANASDAPLGTAPVTADTAATDTSVPDPAVDEADIEDRIPVYPVVSRARFNLRRPERGERPVAATPPVPPQADPQSAPAPLVVDRQMTWIGPLDPEPASDEDTFAEPAAAVPMSLAPEARIDVAPEKDLANDEMTEDDLPADDMTPDDPATVNLATDGLAPYDTPEDELPSDDATFLPEVDEATWQPEPETATDPQAPPLTEVDESWLRPVFAPSPAPQMQDTPLAPEPDVHSPDSAAAAIDALTAKIALLEAQLAESRKATTPQPAPRPDADAAYDPDEGPDLAPDDNRPAAWQTAWQPDGPTDDAPTDGLTEFTEEDARAEAEAALREAQAANADIFGTGEAVLDEDSLRELVTDIVREELQGALGERITRNVRKLVRREIHRAFAAQDLD